MRGEGGVADTFQHLQDGFGMIRKGQAGRLELPSDQLPGFCGVGILEIVLLQNFVEAISRAGSGRQGKDARGGDRRFGNGDFRFRDCRIPIRQDVLLPGAGRGKLGADMARDAAEARQKPRWLNLGSAAHSALQGGLGLVWARPFVPGFRRREIGDGNGLAVAAMAVGQSLDLIPRGLPVLFQIL